VKKNKISTTASIVNNNQMIVDYLNNNYPISIKYNEDLVNKVHARYPLLDKSEIGIVVKAIFSTLRDLLIRGETLNINNLFVNARLLMFKHKRGGVIFPAIKAQLDTPPHMKIK